MRWPVKSCLKNDMISDVSRSFALLSVLDEAEVQSSKTSLMNLFKIQEFLYKCNSNHIC